jgi:hypothetical protein
MKVGDLVTYRDQLTTSGNFDGAPLLMVLETMDISTPPLPLGLRLRLHNLRTGTRGWDFAHGYLKMEGK